MAIFSVPKKKWKAKSEPGGSKSSRSNGNDNPPSNSTTTSLPLGELEEWAEAPQVPQMPHRFSPPPQSPSTVSPGPQFQLPVRSPPPRSNSWLNYQGLPYGVNSGDDIWTRYPPQQPPSYTPSPPEPHMRSSHSLPSAVYGSLQSASRSALHLSNDVWHQASAQAMNSTAALFEVISSKLDRVITCIDGEAVVSERDLLMYEHQNPTVSTNEELSRSLDRSEAVSPTKQNHFTKVWLYSNSRLPPYLPPVKFYLPTYRLMCLAAQYSLQVYDKPSSTEREVHVSASVLKGTKAMVLKSLPLDDMNIIVFAIRGTTSFMDWAINFRIAPTTPKDFLDDEGNLTHVGFLGVAKAMITPVATRLRTLLQENPSRRTASLLITGHSAGGAIAQLLYMHMMSERVSSELTYLTSFFKRVHCVTFGAPPVTLLPLKKADNKKLKKSLFFAFANEGDPVVRADTTVIRSLLRLLAGPAPNHPCPITSTIKKVKKGKASTSTLNLAAAASSGPVWEIPQTTLSLGGRLVLLREKLGARDKDDIEACQVRDDMFRGVVFGDPICHSMTLYARRLEILATNAVLGREVG